MNKETIAKAIKDAFEEGYGSYDTAANSCTTLEDAWAASEAALVYEKVLAS